MQLLHERPLTSLTLSHTMADEHEGIPLMAPEEYVNDFDHGIAHVSARSFKEQGRLPATSRWSKSMILPLLACLVALLSLISNAATFANSWKSALASGIPSKIDASKLRRPGLYLGLERVPAIKLQHGDISQYTARPSTTATDSVRMGWPSAIARVNSIYPHFTFPLDQWVFLTEQVSTPPSLPNE